MNIKLAALGAAIVVVGLVLTDSSTPSTRTSRRWSCSSARW